MNVNTQLSNGSALLPDIQVDCYQKQSKNAQVDGATTSSTGSEGVASQATRESVDQVRLSLAARQAYEASTLPKEMPDLVAGEIVADDDADADGGDAAAIAMPSEEAAPVNGSIAAYEKQAAVGDENPESGTAKAGEDAKPTPAGTVTLSAEAKQQVIELAQRDQEVKVHEAAHAAVGGQYAGAPTLKYETGPDGKRYAVSGEVNIDMSVVPGDPEATMKKADVIRAAALAPAQPSSQDRSVAAQAAQMKATAQAEVMAESAEAAAEMVDASLLSDQNYNKSDNLLERFNGAVA